MSSGDGGNPFESLTSKNSFLNNYFDYVSQVATLGVLSYKDGKIGAGVTTKGIKELTGAAAAEEANKQAREQYEKAQADAEQARLQAQGQQAKDEMRKSLMAGAARSVQMKAPGNKVTALGNSNLGQDEQDFLGL